MMTKDEQIAEVMTASMEDIREENPQRIFEMWMHDRRQMEAKIETLRSWLSSIDNLGSDEESLRRSMLNAALSGKEFEDWL